MKKYIFGIAIALAGGLVFFSSPVSAATLGTLPDKFTVAAGQEVRVVVSVIPAENERGYTVRAALRYPHDLLELKTVAYNNDWVPVIRPGYDEVNREDGTLIKTAGYPGGFAAQKVFAVMEFTAKKSGTGTIIFDDRSFVLDAGNRNILAGTSIPSGVSVRVMDLESSAPEYALANILSFGAHSNVTTFIAVFAFLLVVYLLYAFFRSRIDEEEE